MDRFSHATVSASRAAFSRFRRGAAFAAAFLLLAAGCAAARERPSGLGASGTFLAGVVANAGRDTGAAAEYFREALKADPGNAGLLDQAFLSELVDGNLPEAFRLAERAIQRDKSNALAHVALGVRALKGRDYVRARRAFQRAGGDVREADLTIALLKAWAVVGTGDLPAALQMVDRFQDNELRGYRDFFGGLMAEIGRRPGEAEKRLAGAFKTESGIMRVTEAYARNLSRRNKIPEARETLRQWRERNPGQPFLGRELALLEKGEPLPPLVADVAQGAAEVFYGLGAVGSASRDPMTALIYMQLAHYLSPEDEVITMTLAEFFEQLRRNERAAALYERIPVSSPLANRAVIGRATALERLERTDEAIGILRRLVAAHPEDAEAIDTLGSILRIKKRWHESIEAYDAGLKAIRHYEYKHWTLFFGRAIGYERTKQWPKAEPDFLAALDLLPKRPRTARERAERAQVLNYLGYSWVDQHMNIEKSFEMLREAVTLTPTDGAIVDSLGWAFYRLGRFDEAVRELERAVQLKAGDPTINDHLGDAYWKLGRQREARFKWSQALGLDPEPEDREKIRKKLETGLDEGPAAAVTPKPNGG
jgi:tetratricopeptide (TPR) repeat protein